MTAPRAGVLYTPELLGLATTLARYPLDTEAGTQAEIRSRSCGSVLALSCAFDDVGRIEAIGLRVTACAVGQAAAAIFAKAAIGRSVEDIAAADHAIARWLTGDGPVPAWPGIEAIAAALPHTGRHEAIRLPWRAALAALSKAESQS